MSKSTENIKKDNSQFQLVWTDSLYIYCRYLLLHAEH